MFRLLGLHPGPDVTALAAASLAATAPQRANLLLRELTRAHLLAEHAPGRFASTTCYAPMPASRPAAATVRRSATPH
jgi:hypothetical protein